MALYTATYPATVTFNEDPEQRGRIRVACAGLMGDEDAEVPVDVEPVFDWGWFFVPDVGEVVEIEVIEGSSEDEQMGQASIDNLDIKWRGARYYGNEEGDAPTPVNPVFSEENYGKRRGFATPAGHVFMFDDTEGAEEIRISWKDGTSYWSIDKDGQVTAVNKDGASIVMNTDGSILMTNAAGATINMDAAGDKISATAALLELNGASEAAVLGDAFKTYFDTHTHPTGVGPSGPPAAPMPPTTLSTIVKVG